LDATPCTARNSRVDPLSRRAVSRAVRASTRSVASARHSSTVLSAWPTLRWASHNGYRTASKAARGRSTCAPSWTSSRSTSEPGDSCLRPYPPTASRTVPGGAGQKSSTTARSTTRARRAASDLATMGSALETGMAASSVRASSRAAIAGGRSDGVGSHLPRADPERLLDGHDPDLPVADLAGPGGRHDQLDDLVHAVVLGEHLDLHLRHEVDLVLGAAIDLGVPALSSEPLRFDCGEAAYAGLAQAFLYVVQSVWLDDRDDELHAGSARLARGGLLLPHGRFLP